MTESIESIREELRESLSSHTEWSPGSEAYEFNIKMGIVNPPELVMNALGYWPLQHMVDRMSERRVGDFPLLIDRFIDPSIYEGRDGPPDIVRGWVPFLVSHRFSP